MKRSELKVGEAYVSASVGYDRNSFHGQPAILLDTNVDSSRNGFDYRVSRPRPNVRTGKASPNKVLVLMEAGLSQDRVSVMGAQQFQPTTEWIDRWIASFGSAWPNEEQKADRARLNAQLPKGWNIVAVPPARLWMTWAEFIVQRDAHRVKEERQHAERVANAARQAGERSVLEAEAKASGLEGFKVASDGKSITISAEDFWKLVSGSLRATA